MVKKKRISLLEPEPQKAPPPEAANGGRRRRKSSGLQRMLVVSLVVHFLGFVGYAVIAAARFEPPDKTDVIPVTLVTMPAPTVSPSVVPPPQPENIQKPTVPDPLVEPPVKKKEEPPPKPPEPEIKEPVKKPKEEPPPPTPEKKGVISEAPARKVDRPTLSDDPVGDIEVEGPEFEFAYYLKAIRRKIASKWNPPVEVAANGETTGVVRFRILRSGEVMEISVWEPSGMTVFDQSALRAVQAAGPLPPLPPEYPADELGIKLRFVR